MNTYFFEIEAIPTNAVTNAKDIAGASVLIFVIANTRRKAETLAREVVINHGWMTKEISICIEPTNAQIADLEKDIKDLYHRALSQGVGYMFVADPEIKRNPYHSAEYRSLDTPILNNKSKRH